MTKEEFMRIGAITPKSRGRRAEDEHCDVKVFLPLTRSGKEPDKVNVNIYNAEKPGISDGCGIILKYDRGTGRLYMLFVQEHDGNAYKLRKRSGYGFYNTVVTDAGLLEKVRALGGTVRGNLKYDTKSFDNDGLWYIQFPTKEPNRSRKYDPAFYDFS